MSDYRIVSLFCRSLSNFFFWSALFNFFSLGSSIYGGRFLFTVGSLVMGALLRVFSSTLATTLLGQSAFEGEALSRTFEKDPHFRALCRSITGLMLIIFGGYQLISVAINMLGSGGYFGYMGTMLAIFLSPALQIGLGIFFAFGGALKRISQSISGVELASPHETESKTDSSP